MNKPSLPTIYNMSRMVLFSMTLYSITACTTEQAVNILEEDNEDVFSISVGDCFDDRGHSAGDEGISNVVIRKCTEQHDNEIYYVYELPDGEFPNSNTEMQEKCGVEFEKFVGLSYEESRYDYDLISPTKFSWSDGDREVLCLIYDGEYAKLGKSAKDTIE